jgi:hypothetical protein
MKIHCTFFLSLLVLLISCSDRRAAMLSLAEEQIRYSLEKPHSLSIVAVSKPDSAFGNGYLSPEEVRSVTALMQSVTAVIMERTNNMTAFNPDDHYVMSLAERQMKANADLRQMLFDCDKKGEWSGWKVKIDYEVHNGHEQNYRAERWFFLDKEGSVIFKTMEFPLP